MRRFKLDGSVFMTVGRCLEYDVAKQPHTWNITFLTFGKLCRIFMNAILEKPRFSGSFLVATLIAIDRTRRFAGSLVSVDQAFCTTRYFR